MSTKCKAKNPATCPHHGQPLQFQQYERTNQKREHIAELSIQRSFEHLPAGSLHATAWTPEDFKEAEKDAEAYLFRTTLLDKDSLKTFKEHAQQTKNNLQEAEQKLIKNYCADKTPQETKIYLETHALSLGLDLPYRQEMDDKLAYDHLKAEDKRNRNRIETTEAYNTFVEKATTALREASAKETNLLTPKTSLDKKVHHALKSEQWVLKETLKEYEKALHQKHIPYEKSIKIRNITKALRATLIDIKHFSEKNSYTY